jgi:hypothetical protein
MVGHSIIELCENAADLVGDRARESGVVVSTTVQPVVRDRITTLASAIERRQLLRTTPADLIRRWILRGLEADEAEERARA